MFHSQACAAALIQFSPNVAMSGKTKEQLEEEKRKADEAMAALLDEVSLNRTYFRTSI